jgi:protein involved in polysaccharide export with SLBB domain
MKRRLASTLLFLLLASSLSWAQSSMTDDQIFQFAVKEQKAGTSQQQIVTKLMQRGVDINQIRRVKRKLERETKQTGLGVVSNVGTNNNDRTRKANTQTDELASENADKYTSGMILDNRYQSKRRTYDENDPEFQEFMKAYKELLPDSLTIQDEFDEFIYEKYQKQKDQRKVFGRNIFNNKDLSFEPNMNIATPENYVLGPGDAVFVDIYGASNKSAQATVTPDGYINIEGYGLIYVSGLTVAQANAKVKSELGKRYSSSKIKLTVGQTKTISVNVMGEVKVPGTYTLSAFSSVFHALYMAGGTNEIGTLRDIKVFRNNKQVASVDIYDYILNGRLRSNIRLTEGDVIMVGPYNCLVNITGKVKRPMYYEMKTSESMSSLLKYSGGFAGDAYTKSVRVVRKTGRQYSIYNVEEFDMGQFLMADGDSVSVDSVLTRYENMVEVKGGVFRPGMYQIGAGINSVRTLVEHAEGVTEQAFLNRAIIHRMKSDRTLEVISVDLKGILAGTVPDVPMKNEDVLFIPTQEELNTEKTITIYGEVFYPGIYKYAENETIEDFVLQAGGLKESASTVKVDVSRRIVNPEATTSNAEIAQIFSMSLKDGFVIDGTPGFTLQPFDEVYVRKSPGTNEQVNVSISGEVLFPGSYSLATKKQRLSDIMKMAGGVTAFGYAKGARLERKVNPEERIRMEEVMKLQREQYEEMQNEQAISLANAKANVSTLKEDANQSAMVQKFKGGDTYYVGIELDKALANPGGDEDITLREGDKIIVPVFNGTVKVNGAVLYPNTVNYISGKKTKYYLSQAGGFGNYANKKGAYIIYQNGNAAKCSDGAKPEPGCEIIVPYKAKKVQNFQQWVTLGTGIASLATIIATLANILK